jgi:hypothetical protein
MFGAAAGPAVASPVMSSSPAVFAVLIRMKVPPSVRHSPVQSLISGGLIVPVHASRSVSIQPVVPLPLRG